MLPLTQALIACDAWRHQQALADCVVFFDEHGIDRKVAARAVSFWGDQAVAKLRENPYRLLTVCPWASVDRVARQLGFARDDRRRLVGGVEAAVYDRLDRKHTATPEARLLADVAARLGCGPDGSRAALGEAVADGAVVGSEAGYQPAGAAHMERFIEDRVREMSRPDGGRRDLLIGTATPADVDAYLDGASAGGAGALTSGQRDAVRLAMSGRFALLTGGAGVGKTTCLRAINATATHFGHHVVQLALAGRAAQRMADATGQPARTIASWLRAAMQGKADTGAHTLMVVDEASMLDLPTTYRLLFHVHRDARLLLVGDIAQLPPIGFGLVLHRLVGCAGVPQVELTEILRSREASGIPSVSRSLRDGTVPALLAYGPDAGGCSFIGSSPEDVAGHVARIRRDLAGEEVQVVGSVYGGPAGIDALNARFHAANAVGKQVLGRFAEGDPVIWTVNDHGRGLWNGSMGVVLEVAGESLTVRLHDKEVVLQTGELGSLDLAYAVSTHKAQGSQFGTVVVPVVRSRLLDRTLLYTAVTRAVRRVVLVGSRTAFEEAVVNPPASLDRDVGFQMT